MQKDNRKIIDIMDVAELLDRYHQKFEFLSERHIRLIDKGDGSLTLIQIAYDNKSVSYEGKVIGGLDE